MNTEKLYIASLRVCVNREFINSRCEKRTLDHLRFVLVKSSNMRTFKDLKTEVEYGTSFYCQDTAILPKEIVPFNEATGNTQKHMTKRKALNLFDKTVDRWRIVE